MNLKNKVLVGIIATCGALWVGVIIMCGSWLIWKW